MSRRLPPFAPLVAFDAVARHRSFTRAADELGVTQSAISHQVRRLEEHFGVQLLKCLNPGIELSEEGARLQRDLAELLDGLASLDTQVRQRTNRQTLRVGAGSSLATWWLVRRLNAFRKLHPDIDIDFQPVESDAGGDPSLDVRIMWTPLAEARATSVQAPLFREHVFPVCAPSLLPEGRPLSDASGLLDLPLIQKTSTPTGEWSWATWFRTLGLKREPSRDLVLGDMGLCLTAAVDGAGVAIARSLLVADAIKEGRLVSALADPPEMLSSKVHIARWNTARVGDRNIQMLVQWLAEAAAETSRDVAGHATRGETVG